MELTRLNFPVILLDTSVSKFGGIFRVSHNPTPARELLEWAPKFCGTKEQKMNE